MPNMTPYPSDWQVLRHFQDHGRTMRVQDLLRAIMESDGDHTNEWAILRKIDRLHSQRLISVGIRPDPHPVAALHYWVTITEEGLDHLAAMVAVRERAARNPDQPAVVRDPIDMHVRDIWPAAGRISPSCGAGITVWQGPYRPNWFEWGFQEAEESEDVA